MPSTKQKDAWNELVQILNYVEIEGEITEDNVLPLLDKLEIAPEKRALKIKGIWHQFKQFHVHDTDKNPILFIKELWEYEFFREILALHIGINYLDDELCPKNYLFGKWKQNEKTVKPIIAVTYIPGDPLKKKQIKDFLYDLGRQHAFHYFLSLYDVGYRHFIIHKERLVRIDFGRAFTNLEVPYQGFWQLPKYILKDPRFKQGSEYEFDRISKKTGKTWKELLHLIEMLENIGEYGNFFINFDLNKFLEKLKNYWRVHMPYYILDAHFFDIYRFVSKE